MQIISDCSSPRTALAITYDVKQQKDNQHHYRMHLHHHQYSSLVMQRVDPWNREALHEQSKMLDS